MNDKNRKEERDRTLWRRWRADSQETAAGKATVPDELTLAAYLDGALGEAESAEVEGWLATAPEGLELVLAARAALAEPGVAAPESVVRRAAALVPDPPASRLAGRLTGAFAALWQPLGWSGAVAGVLLACLVGFQLGQSGYQSSVALEEQEVAEAGSVFDPADEEIL